jgi:hypothetical protein
MESVVLRSPAPSRDVVPLSRHRREQAKPGCLRGLLAVPGLLVRLAWAKVRRAVAQLCGSVVSVRTACGTASTS